MQLQMYSGFFQIALFFSFKSQRVVNLDDFFGVGVRGDCFVTSDITTSW